MPANTQTRKTKLPGGFERLSRMLIPHAIMNENQYDKAVLMIDDLMAGGRLTRDQALYLETLVQLVQAYEASHHVIMISDISGLDSLKHLMAENQMHASDLARLLGVHVSMGSKILKGDRSLTIDHLKKLAARFKISPSVFID